MLASSLGFSASGEFGSPASTWSSSFWLKGSGAPKPSKPSPFFDLDATCTNESSSSSLPSSDTMLASSLGFSASGAFGSPASTWSSSFWLKGSGAPNPSKPSPFLTLDATWTNESSSSSLPSSETTLTSSLGFSASGAFGSPASTWSSSFWLNGSGAPNPSKP